MKKGFTVLPNLLTLGGLFNGFLSIVYTLERDFFHAAIFIFVALFFDMLDGQVARMSNSITKFGRELDSLSDMISFGISPGLLVFTWLLQPAGRFGWLAAFLYVACAALRLARFNARKDPDTTKFFFGLPTPAAAGFIASFYLFTTYYNLPESIIEKAAPLSVFVLATLMVSTIRYPSPKELPVMRNNHFQVLVLSVFLLIAIAYKPRLMLFLLGSIYIVSGPLYQLFFFKRQELKKQHATDNPAVIPLKKENSRP